MTWALEPQIANVVKASKKQRAHLIFHIYFFFVLLRCTVPPSSLLDLSPASTFCTTLWTMREKSADCSEQHHLLSLLEKSMKDGCFKEKHTCVQTISRKCSSY